MILFLSDFEVFLMNVHLEVYSGDLQKLHRIVTLYTFINLLLFLLS